MATLNATLSLTSSDVSSSALSFTVTDALTVGTPNIGMSREVAAITTPTTLVPATAGTKYLYVKHLGLKANGVSATTNTVNLQTVTAAPVSTSITPVVDGVTLAAIAFDTYSSADAVFVALNAALAAQPGILKSEHTTTSPNTVVTVTGANLGDSTTISITTDISGGGTVATSGSSPITAASGASTAILRPGEFAFLPVKGGEGLSAISAGVDSLNGCMLEYAYWTKLTE